MTRAMLHAIPEGTTPEPSRPAQGRSLGRRIYGAEPTRPIPIEPDGGSREPDAPVPMERRRASAHRSASTSAFDPRERSIADATLRDELHELLSDMIEDSRDLQVWASGSVVLLCGRVASELDRLLAEDLVFTRPEVRECRNELVIAPPGSHPVVAGRRRRPRREPLRRARGRCWSSRPRRWMDPRAMLESLALSMAMSGAPSRRSAPRAWLVPSA